MDIKTKRTICLVVGIASILTIVSTISYAYFTTMGDMTPVGTDLSTARISVVFDDNDAGISGELNFGQSITKRFTIENTGTVDAHVKMYWLDLVNTYMENSLTFTLSYSENESGPYSNLISNRKVPQARSLSKQVLADYLTIPYSKTYYYNLTITLNNIPELDQTPDLNAIFNSKFTVEDTRYMTPIEKIIASSNGEKINFDEPATTDEGVFEMEDDYGTSYYFRGAVENNYVKFADYYWRIIRLNGDGSLRIIYDGTTAHANGETSDDRFTHLGQPFNKLSDDAKYIGWMYGPANSVTGITTPSTSKEEAQNNIVNSDIKVVVDEWYKTNIEDKGYSSVVSDTLFCSDRTLIGKDEIQNLLNTGLGYGKNYTVYGVTKRIKIPLWNINISAPTFKCSQKNDAFTVNDTTNGNGELTYPVGLIIGDEVIAAGSGSYNTTNKQYYLYRSGDNYWTFSPFGIDSYLKAYIFSVNKDVTRYIYTNEKGAVAPVINLNEEYVSSMVGDGTMENPYRTE